MARVVGIDHLSIRVSDYDKSKAFYNKLLTFLGFRLAEEYEDSAGWSNGHTLFWIGRADGPGAKHKHRTGEVGFHHYAFRLSSRKDVDELQAFLQDELGADDRGSGGEYYDDYYAVFFLDPDGMKLEGMKYGENTANKT